ncbi:MAG: Ig-like domain-containing protein [Patescibacteria group bacterium]|nr:Ig-like domain-containing protein [Patescibacteria group bacterium]
MNKQNLVFGLLGKFSKRKAIMVSLTLIAFFSLALPVLALETGLEYGTATGLGTQDIRITIMRVIQIFLGLIGIIALVIIIYGGYTWMTSAGNPEQIDKAKRILRNAAIGLVIILSAFSIVSFIINALENATGIGHGVPGGPPPGNGCENCGHLGTGIIQSVYPVNNQRDVARNTNIMVTFKVTMDPGTIIEDCTLSELNANGSCSGNLVSSHVKIFKTNDDEDNKLGDAEVVVSTNDGKTFVFDPVNYLGTSEANNWYSVKLTDGIRKDNGQTAFEGNYNYFLWSFEIGTFLDIDPVEVASVFPNPDDEGDDYSEQPGTATAGALTLAYQPQVSEASQTSAVFAVEGSPSASTSGIYNCAVDAKICLDPQAGGVVNIKAVEPSNPSADDCTSEAITVTGLSSSATITNGAINIGCGLTVSFAGTVNESNQWRLRATAQKDPDTLRVANKTYRFGLDIELGETTADTAENIAQVINDDIQTPNILATASGSTVDFTSSIAGSAGNFNLLPSTNGDSWFSDLTMTLGTNTGFGAETNDAPDQPRNAVIVVNFNEPINPSDLADNIAVEYLDESGTWVTVAAAYLVSNQYQTVEILSNEECRDPDTGELLSNSCGDKIYCWPYNNPDPYEATQYRVTVKAGLLKTCLEGDCTDANFSTCTLTPGGTDSVCGGLIDEVQVFYPEAQDAPQGITDAANNSFNGNYDTFKIGNIIYGRAQGPQSQSGAAAYSLNSEVGTFGDDLTWNFFINKDLDLTPPTIDSIGPDILEQGVSLTENIEVTFNEVMMSSSLKSGSNYRDGSCYCDVTNSACPSGQSCDTSVNKCKSVGGTDAFCLEDNECPNNNAGTPEDEKKLCLNKKYITLIDPSVFGIGWWLTKQDLDLITPFDGLADQTMAQVRHTTFAEVSNYGVEVGSGVKDIYQNCFLPSVGPDSSGGVCDGTAQGRAYCCNGIAQNEAEWKAGACFTGF